MPYDAPSQAAWMSSPTTEGYAAVLVSPTAQHFTGYGMGTYSFFNQGIEHLRGSRIRSADTRPTFGCTIC